VSRDSPYYLENDTQMIEERYIPMLVKFAFSMYEKGKASNCVEGPKHIIFIIIGMFIPIVAYSLWLSAKLLYKKFSEKKISVGDENMRDYELPIDSIAFIPEVESELESARTPQEDKDENTNKKNVKRRLAKSRNRQTDSSQRNSHTQYPKDFFCVPDEGLVYSENPTHFKTRKEVVERTRAALAEGKRVVFKWQLREQPNDAKLFKNDVSPEAATIEALRLFSAEGGNWTHHELELHNGLVDDIESLVKGFHNRNVNLSLYILEQLPSILSQ